MLMHICYNGMSQYIAYDHKTDWDRKKRSCIAACSWYRRRALLKPNAQAGLLLVPALSPGITAES